MSGAWVTQNFQREKEVLIRVEFHDRGLRGFEFSRGLSSLNFFGTTMRTPLRPCYTRQFFLHALTCNATTCNTPFSKLAMQQNVALQVARKVELSSTFRNVARQVAACNMSSATCNVFHPSSLRCKLQEKLPHVTWPLDSKEFYLVSPSRNLLGQFNFPPSPFFHLVPCRIIEKKWKQYNK